MNDLMRTFACLGEYNTKRLGIIKQIDTKIANKLNSKRTTQRSANCIKQIAPILMFLERVTFVATRLIIAYISCFLRRVCACCDLALFCVASMILGLLLIAHRFR